MTSWTFDVYQARNVQGRTLTASEARATCNPRVNIEYAGEKLVSTSQATNTRDPNWNETLKAESREAISRGRFRLTFKVVHKPEWAGPEAAHTLSYATVFVSNDNSREFRKKLLLKSDITHEENGGWIEVGWRGTDVNKKEKDEAAAKAAMLRSMGSKWSVGDKILARDDDSGTWKTGIVQEIAYDGTPKVKLEKEPKKESGKVAETDDKKDKSETKEAKNDKKEEPKEAGKKEQEDDSKAKKDSAPSEKEKTDTKKQDSVQSAKLLPNQPLTHLINLGSTGHGNSLDAELVNLQVQKDAAVAAEKYTEAQALKEQIEAYKSMKQQSGGWRTEAPVSSLVKACRRIDFESGKSIEAGTIGEVIGGLVRMGSALFTPTPGDIECYGVSMPGQPHPRPNMSESIPVRSYSPAPVPVSMPTVNSMSMTSGPSNSWQTHNMHQPQVAAADMAIIIVPQAESWSEMVLKHLQPSDTVATVKTRIQGINGTPTSNQCLSQHTVDDRKRKLDDRRTLASYGIRSGDVLTLTNSSRLMHVAITVENRHKVRIAVPLNSSVLSLKQRLAERENIPVSKQVLELDGTELVDGSTLSSYDISSDTMLIMYERSGHHVSHKAMHTKGCMKLTVIAETATSFKTLTIDCKSDESIRNIKHRLQYQGGLHDIVTLKYEDQLLSDGYHLSEYGITDGSVVTAHMVPQLQNDVPHHTSEVDALKDQVKELQAMVGMMCPQPAITSLSPRTDDVLHHSKQLRSVAESEMARASGQLANLDHPVPRVLASPPRSRPDIIGTDRFRQMQKVVAERSHTHT